MSTAKKTPIMFTFLAFIALSGIGMIVFHYMSAPYNDAFERFPWAVKLHVVLGGIYLAFGALQYSTSIRGKAIWWHRSVGRVLAVFALVTGATAIFVGIVMPFSGPIEQITMAIFGSYYIYAVSTAWRRVRGGDIAGHRAWMIRAYALGSSVVTMRLIFIPALILTEATTDAEAATLSIMSFLSAFLLHIIAGEIWLWRTRKWA